MINRTLIEFIIQSCYNFIMKYMILLHKSKSGYNVHVPVLPGCHSQGDTKKEALINIKDAISTYLEMEKEELRNSEIQEVEVAIP